MANSGQSQYQNLGQFNFTTAPDQTGLNPGNMTSTFDTGQFKPSKFELYRLVLGVPGLPSSGQTPMVVQAVEGRAASLTALTLTFPETTTKGNLILVGVVTWADTTNPLVSAVTIGGAADNFAAVSGTASGNTAPIANSTVLWADPASADTGTAIAITASGGSGTNPNLIGFAWEVSGATTLDVSGKSLNGSSIVPSLTTSVSPTTAANDIVFAVAGTETAPSQNAGYNGALTEQTPQGGFTVGGPGNSIYGNAGYVPVPLSGGSASQTIAITSGDSGYFTQSIAAFLATTASPTPSEIPFTVKIGNKTWDINQTTAGVGFTYDPQNAMYLNQGEQLSILWTDLPSNIYNAYSQNFTVVGSFRYDPSLPNNSTT